MKRRMVSAVLTLAIAMFSAFSPVASATGVGAAKFTASNTSVSRGDTFVYTLSLSDTDSLRGLYSEVVFDDTKLEVVDSGFYSPEIGIVSDIAAASGLVKNSATYESAVDLNGDFAFIEFRVDDEATSGPVELYAKKQLY